MREVLGLWWQMRANSKALDLLYQWMRPELRLHIDKVVEMADGFWATMTHHHHHPLLLCGIR